MKTKTSSLTKRSNTYRPRLEALEGRALPGETMFSGLVNAALLEPLACPDDRDANNAAITCIKAYDLRLSRERAAASAADQAPAQATPAPLRAVPVSPCLLHGRETNRLSDAVDLADDGLNMEGILNTFPKPGSGPLTLPAGDDPAGRGSQAARVSAGEAGSVFAPSRTSSDIPAAPLRNRAANRAAESDLALVLSSRPAVQRTENLPFIVTTDNPANHVVTPGSGYDGVASLLVNFAGGSGLCSGTLLTTGRHLLTAAHCFTDSAGRFTALSAGATFHLTAGAQTVAAVSVAVHPGWNGNLANGNDLAVVRLGRVAPAAANRYDLYRSSDELSRTFVRVGYGRSGTGDAGHTLAEGTKRSAGNRYEALGDAAGRQLASDFDSGLAAHNVFGDLGLGTGESNPAPGDSGGPTFISGRIAGVTSYGYGFTGLPDVSPGTNSSFGEVSVDTRVSAYAGWIDPILRDKAGVVRDVGGAGQWSLDVNGNGTWDPSGGDVFFSFGLATDTPVVGDWNGDGRAKAGVVRNVGGAAQWSLDVNGNGTWDPAGGDVAISFGLATDTPVVGDWNGDGRDDLGVVRNVGGAGQWSLDYSGDRQWGAGDVFFSFGLASDKPVAGDWNGDGRAKAGVVRDYGGAGQWSLDVNGNGTWDPAGGDVFFSFGLASDNPVAGDWNGDGRAKAGVVRNVSGAGQWSLDVNGNGGWDPAGGDISFYFGLTTDKPLAGNW